MYPMRNYLLEGDFKALSTLQTKEQDKLLELSNVVGVGLGHKHKNGVDTGEPSLLVLVNQKLDREFLNDGDLVPASFGKYKTDVIEVGDIFAQTSVTNNDRLRPTMGGCQIRSAAINGWGTLGTTVIRRNATMPTQHFILSNRHVLGNVLGADVFQPATLNPADKVADVSQFAPLGPFVDCAIAEVLEFDKCSPEIYGIGYVEGVTNVQPGTRVQKSGARTGYTKGTVQAINATVAVNYGGTTGIITFFNQIITTAMSAPGDSGSIGLDMRNNAFGLLFAGSTTITVFNPISAVLSALNIEFLGV